MQIELPDEVQHQAVAAGFASVEDYVTTLLDRDAERVAIQQGLQAMESGKVRDFDEFDRDFRVRNRLSERA